MIEFNADAVPEELRERNQWICWSSETRNGKDTKIPKNPNGGGNAKTNDSATWSTFEQACETAQERGWGLGFVFTPVDPFVGIDIDSCLDADGRPKDWSTEIGLDPFVNKTFIETSPSGTGLHVYVQGSIPDWWTDQDRDGEDGSHEGVEVYEETRFFTITGDTTGFSKDAVMQAGDLEDWLKTAWNQFNNQSEAPWKSSPNPRGSTSASTGSDDVNVDLYDILRRTSYPEEERRSHPVHGSDTGSNFKVDDGAETFRCYRHSATGNALHLIGMQEDIIECGEWLHRDIDSDAWSEIFDAARERGLDVGEKTRAHTSAAEEAAETATDGGTKTTTQDNSSTEAVLSVPERVRAEVLTPVDPPEDYDGESIDAKVAVQRFTDILLDEYDFVRPREDVRGWRDTLYVYDGEEGIYQPHGRSFVEEQAERLLGSWVNNQQINEIAGKISRRSMARPGELDTEPEMLCVANGILNLHTGDLIPHSPDEYHRTKLDVKYDPSAECRDIDEFFHDIVEASDVDTIYRLIAHCVYGEYAAEKAAMLVGDGQNGKSVLLSLVEEFLGQHNVSHRALQEFSDNDFAANDLEGKLANVHPDMGDEMVRDLGTFKKLTGRDTMTANVKYEKPVTFENHATLLFAANRMPAMSEDTHALWRRWIYINFPYKFDSDDPDAKDETPKRVLMRELTEQEQLEGLLARCVEEISAWHDGRQWFPDVMQPEQVREKMKRASEPVYDFVATCMRMGDDDDWVRKDKVREAYREYARQEGLPTKTGNALGQKLLNLRDYPIESGQKRVDGARATVYMGVEFTSRGRQILGMDTDKENEDIEETQNKAKTIREIVRELDTGDGVTKGMILGRASSKMGMSTAEKALETAKARGEIMSMDGGSTFEVP